MRRAFTVILLLVEALFFNVVIPGHARGVIQLPGSGNCPACCAAKHSPSQQTPCNNQSSTHCAICAFAAAMFVPPPVDFAPPPTRLVATLTVANLQTLITPSFPLSYFGRAPPDLHA